MATMFKQTLRQRSSAPEQMAEPQFVDPYEALIMEQRKKLQQPMTPMYTPEQIDQRRGENQNQYALGLLGQLSGDEGLGNVGGQVFKQALAMRQPKITERGTADQITGQFTYDPDYLRQRDEANLSGLEQKSAAARGAFTESRQRAQERAEERRRHDEVLLEMRRMSSENGQVGAFQQSGFTPDGKSVVTNSKSGLNYIVSAGPNGQAIYQPYSGITTPKGTYDKAVVEAQEQLGAADRAKKLITRIEANPEAFGIRAAAVGAMPGPMQGWLGSVAGLTREQLNLRAQVTRDAAMELNRIYGAAQSAGELARASAWAPNATDGFETTITKLQAAKEWAEENAQRAGPGVVNAARGRSGSGATGVWPAAAPAAGGVPASASSGLSPEEASELANLRERFKNR